MLLTDNERKQFIAYLEQQISSSKAIASQFAKLSLPVELVKTMVDKEKIQQMACEVVRNMLNSAEEFKVR